jgi:hypothetical protein
MAAIVQIRETVTAISLRVTPGYKYRAQKKTDERILDEDGRPLTRITGFGRVLGSIQEFQIEVPDQVAEEVSVGTVIAPVGNLTVELRGGDFGALNAKVRGADKIVEVSTADALFDQLADSAQTAKPAQKPQESAQK